MKDSDLLRYYDSEMRYLKEAAHEFAEQFPALGQQLGMYRDSTKRDDDVERLFQGFAFIMAKMRQKTDDDIPELTEPSAAGGKPDATVNGRGGAGAGRTGNAYAGADSACWHRTAESSGQRPHGQRGHPLPVPDRG